MEIQRIFIGREEFSGRARTNAKARIDGAIIENSWIELDPLLPTIAEVSD